MLPVHPGELVQMRWEDVDLVGADWRYVVSKTKHLDKSKHIVPLPEQVLVLLRELSKTRVVDEEGKGWVFVSPVYPGRLINPTSMLKSFQRIWPEYAITAHGFRATYRTIAHEHLGIDPIVLELSLSHRMPGALGAVYARATAGTAPGGGSAVGELLRPIAAKRSASDCRLTIQRKRS